MQDKINVTAEKMPKSMVKLTIVSKDDDLALYTDKAYEKLSKNVAVEGFRKGKAPKKLIVERLGLNLYDEALNMLLTDLANKALVQEKINPLTQPHFHVEEFKADKPVTFSIEFAVYPTVELGDLTKVKISSADVKKAKTRREEIEEQQKKSKEDKKELKKGEKKPEAKEEKKEEKPKEVFNLDKYYSEILDKIFAISKIEIPDELIEHDVLHQEENFISRLEELGIKPEDYLKMQNLTIEQARENWKKDIEFSFKQDLVLNQYAKDKGLKVEDDEVKKELDSMYTKEQITKLDPQMYNYASYAILRQKAFLDLLNFIETNNANTNSN